MLCQFPCCHSCRTSWVTGGVKIIVAVDTSEGYVCGFRAADALVGYTLVVKGEIVGSIVATGGCGVALAG